MDTKQEEVASPLRDMNGNVVREGDLVMVILDKPCVAGYVVSVREPSVLTPTKQQQPGVITIHGIVSIGFRPGQVTILGNVAKLVHPQSDAIVEAVADAVKKPHVVLPINEAKKESANPTSIDGKSADSVERVAPDVS
jgi:hypothetical protein